MRNQYSREFFLTGARATMQRQIERRMFLPQVETRRAFSILQALGYDATRKLFDYCIRHGHMELPPKRGDHLVWGVKNIVDFGMQLERMRKWLPFRHDQKKTVWERQAESDRWGLRSEG